MFKFCSGCQTEKSYSEFNKDRTKARGISSHCKVCAANLANLHYRNKAEKVQRITARSFGHLTEEERKEHQRLKVLVGATKCRKWEVEITYEYLVKVWQDQKGRCPYSGLPLTPERNQPNTMSLDRINSKVGYVKGNVQLVCAMVNRMKQEFPEGTFLSMCQTITENIKTKTTQTFGPCFDNSYTKTNDL